MLNFREELIGILDPITKSVECFLRRILDNFKIERNLSSASYITFEIERYFYHGKYNYGILVRLLNKDMRVISVYRDKDTPHSLAEIKSLYDALISKLLKENFEKANSYEKNRMKSITFFIPKNN